MVVRRAEWRVEEYWGNYESKEEKRRAREKQEGYWGSNKENRRP